MGGFELANFDIIIKILFNIIQLSFKNYFRLA